MTGNESQRAIEVVHELKANDKEILAHPPLTAMLAS